jgi:uncharacterized protein
MPNIMTLEQTAEYLHLHPVTLRNKARRGELPAIKLGRQWRFVKAQLDEWLRGNVVVPPGTGDGGLLTAMRANRSHIEQAAAQFGARSLRVFGSVARGEDDADSDVDILVDLESGRSLLDLAGLQLVLEELLERSVDVVTEGGLRERMRDRILREAVAL